MDKQSPDELVRNALKKLNTDIRGAIHIESMDEMFQLESIRSKLNIPLHEWRNPALYSDEDKGRLLAFQIIQNRIQFVERAHSTIDAHNRKARATTNKPKSKASRMIRSKRR